VKKNKRLEQIDIQFMQDIFDFEFKKPIINFVKNTNDMTKIFLVALLYEFNNKYNKILDQNSLFKRFNSILAST